MNLQQEVCGGMDWIGLWLLEYRTIILPVVLYGCETWSLTFREESRFEGV